MSTKTEKESLELLYVRWSDDEPKVCTHCGSEIEYLYNDGGRSVITLNGKIGLYTCYYVCTNSTCTFSKPFTLPQQIVLPYKHYGLDVWRWVITDHVEFHDAYESIAKRLRVHNDLEISPNTVKAIIETFLVANSQEANQKTAQLVRESKQIYLALDGQRPNNGESGLWLFIDTITNRILHLEYLRSASWEVLKEIFQKIEAKYGVPIKAVISDHQASIIKAVREFSPTIPHQFCHYHFLKNLHRTVNALDSHLHVKLSEAIHRLYICNLQPLTKPLIVQGQTLDRREWAIPIVDDLFQMLRVRTRAFDIFAGLQVYEQLREYLEVLIELSREVLPLKPLHTLIKRTIIDIKQTLKAQAPLFLKLKTLLPLFQDMRTILGRTPAPKSKLKQAATRWKSQLQQLYQTLTGHPVAHKLKWQCISAKTPLEEIVAEWIRLYSSHKQGLFHFLKMPKLPRSNVALEKMFSLEVHHFRRASGRAQVGNMVRVKGGELCIVQQNFDPDLINQVLLHQDQTQIKAGLARFRQRHQLQSVGWHSKKQKAPRIRQLIKTTHELLTKP
jgi:hypothetical protein